MLRHLGAELVIRAERFKRLGGIGDIAQLAPGPDRPPRILLVLDEFQVLLADDDEVAEESAARLEALGPAGTRLRAARGLRDADAGRHPVARHQTRRDLWSGALPHRAQDDAGRLAGHAPDPQPRRRPAAAAGQAVLNDSFGAPDANRQILVAHAERAYLDRLRGELWRQAVGKPPKAFVLDAPANLPAAITEARRLPIPGSAGGPLARFADGVPTARAATPGSACRPASTGGRSHWRSAPSRVPGWWCSATTRRPRWACSPRAYTLRETVEARDPAAPPVHVIMLGMHRALRMTVPPDAHRTHRPTPCATSLPTAPR